MWNLEYEYSFKVQENQMPYCVSQTSVDFELLKTKDYQLKSK